MATKDKDKVIVKANINFMRQTARKVRRTVNLIRGLKAGEAVLQLSFMPYAAAKPIKKLIESAIANASNNFSVEDAKQLELSQILVDDGPIFKRFRAASKGRATSIYKRTSQVTLVLSDMTAPEYAQYVKENSPRNQKGKTPKAEKPAKAETKKATKATTAEKKPAAKKPAAKKESSEKKPAAKKATTAKKPAAKKPAAKKATKKKEEDK